VRNATIAGMTWSVASSISVTGASFSMAMNGDEARISGVRERRNSYGKISITVLIG
jgi:hypothetical protein